MCFFHFRSRGKDSEYENVDSDLEGVGAAPKVNKNNRSESEQREIDEFEEEERKVMSQESQVSQQQSASFPRD